MKSAKKIETEQRHEASVVNALNYIWHHPGEVLDLERLSRECHVSKFHLHRLFREYQGETLNEYVSRKRLEFAANQLVMLPYISVAQIATNLGYSSAANFSKAFKRYFGITPREWRCPDRIDTVSDSRLKSKYGKVIDPKKHYSDYQFKNNKQRQRRLQVIDGIISFVRLEERTLMYRTVKDGMNMTATLPMWSQVIEWATNHVENWQNKLFGVWYDNTYVCPKNLMRHDAAVLVPNSFSIPRPFMRQTLDAGIYATGILKGSGDELSDFARDIYVLWFAKNRIIPEIKPYFINYLNDVEEDGFFEIRFFIKILTKGSNKNQIIRKMASANF